MMNKVRENKEKMGKKGDGKRAKKFKKALMTKISPSKSPVWAAPPEDAATISESRGSSGGAREPPGRKRASWTWPLPGSVPDDIFYSEVRYGADLIFYEGESHGFAM